MRTGRKAAAIKRGGERPMRKAAAQHDDRIGSSRRRIGDSPAAAAPRNNGARAIHSAESAQSATTTTRSPRLVRTGRAVGTATDIRDGDDYQ